MKKIYTTKERKLIYRKALSMISENSYNFICNYIKDVIEAPVSKEDFPEFFLFKDVNNHNAWLSHQIDPDVELPLDKVSEVKVLVLGFCIAMCESNSPSQ